MSVCACTCVHECRFGIGGGEGGERERTYMGFVCMLSAELGQACVNFAWAAIWCHAGPSQRHQSTRGNLSMWKPLCTAFMYVHFIVLESSFPQVHIIGDHSLAISGYQGRLCVSASRSTTQFF